MIICCWYKKVVPQIFGIEPNLLFIVNKRICNSWIYYYLKPKWPLANLTICWLNQSQISICWLSGLFDSIIYSGFLVLSIKMPFWFKTVTTSFGGGHFSGKMKTEEVLGHYQASEILTASVPRAIMSKESYP